MGTKSKFFRAFVEGQTISDGRVIEGPWIDQIVETFNLDTYTPRCNIEHISGYSPEPPFNGYGDVCAVKAQTDDFVIDGKTEKRRALYCQVDANDQLVTLSGAAQKPFPSVELTPSYAGTGKIGLIGLAFTDKPASIGTQALQFNRTAPGTVFAPSADSVALEFEAKPAEATGIADAITAGLAKVASMFSRAEPEKPKEPANDNFDPAKFATAMGDVMALAVKPLADAQAKQQADFAEFKAKLESTEQTGFSRTPAAGGAGTPVTDC
jgi:hypothetical protein